MHRLVALMEIQASRLRARAPIDTDWQRIVVLYDAFAQLVPSPVVELNRAAAIASGPPPMP